MERAGIEREVLNQRLCELIQARNSEGIYIPTGMGSIYPRRSLKESSIEEFSAAMAELLQLSVATATGKRWLLRTAIEAFKAFLPERKVMWGVRTVDHLIWSLFYEGCNAGRAEEKIFHRAVVETCLEIISEAGFAGGTICPEWVSARDALTAVAGAAAMIGRLPISLGLMERVGELVAWSGELLARYGDSVASHYAAISRLGIFLRAEQD